MPNPALSILILSLIFLICLCVSYILITFIASKKHRTQKISDDTPPKDDDEKIFFITEQPKKRRKRKTTNTPIAIKGKIVSTQNISQDNNNE